MIFLDRQKMFGAVKISCSPLTFVLAFFQTQKDKIQGKIHPPIPSEEVPPSRKQSWTSAVKVSPGQPSAVAEELRRAPRRWRQPPSAAEACGPRSRAFLGKERRNNRKLFNNSASRTFPAVEAAFLCT
ncbi:uncharacterized protein LOC143693142 isoform X2 [Agelaius phoeniceus]|uniref:uncharacterized protein LOC143693142 isoform X2 n=1 Tax=Agelaius phoeniceus TaxID=39638 RepID=UPI004054D2D2